MKLNEVIARLPAWYMSSCEDGGPSYWLESPPGMGKTTVLCGFLAAMKRVDPAGNYGFVLINGACLTLSTACGYLWPKEGPANDKGETIPYSRFTRPDWWFTAEGHPLEYYTDGGVILIDEADKMGPDEKKIAGEASLSKRFASHKLPPGWVVWFAANRLTDRSGSTKDLDHLINRRCTIGVRPDIESWSDWARTHNILPEVITFGEENVHILFSEKPDIQGAWCTPRSLAQANTHLAALMSAFQTDMIPIDSTTQEEIAGMIGTSAAAQLFVTIRIGQELPKYEAIVAAPAVVKVPSKPDGKRLVSYKLASRVNEKDARAVLTYMARMEEEFQVMFVRQACARNYQLIFQPDFGKWCAEKTALIAVIDRYKNAR